MVFINDCSAEEEKSSLRRLPFLICLTQHRVAWLEQLVLRIKGIPHVVLNSPYSSCEATGPLPFVQGYDKNLKHSFLVGRTHPTNTRNESCDYPTILSSSPGCSSSDILLFLRVEHNIDLDCDLVMDDGDSSTDSRLISKLTVLQCSDRLAYFSLIHEDLHPTFQAIQFCDEISYNTCYLPTSKQIMKTMTTKKTCTNKDNKYFNLISVLYHPLHYLQSFFQRASALSYIQSRYSSHFWRNNILFTKKTCGQQQVNFLAAISHINDIYSILNNRLKMKSTIQVEEDGDGGRGRQQHQQQQPLFLLGTPYPTNVDAVLFAHLAEALTDVHVLPILSQYETLMDFFQIIFHTYFGPNYRFPPSSPNEEVDHVCMEELVKRNNATNYRNASGTHVYNSIQVDAASILRLHLNKNSLWDAATVQQQQYDHFNGGGETIHRWLMDGGIFPESNDETFYGPAFVNRRQQQQSKKDDETTTHNNRTPSHEEASYQEQRQNDDILWLKWIAATFVGAIFIFSQQE